MIFLWLLLVILNLDDQNNSHLKNHPSTHKITLGFLRFIMTQSLCRKHIDIIAKNVVPIVDTLYLIRSQ